jgi:hypothetical protein
MYTATRYQASSQKAKANGQVIMPYLSVLRNTELEHLIADYGLRDLQADKFYTQQIVCDMQRQMADKLGLFSSEMVNIGKQSIDSIPFPDDVTTIAGAMGVLHTIYQAIHQGIPADEGWRVETRSPDEIDIYFNSPYEPYAAYGYIFSIVARFRPENRRFSVYMDEDGPLAHFRVLLG